MNNSTSLIITDISQLHIQSRSRFGAVLLLLFGAGLMVTASLAISEPSRMTVLDANITYLFFAWLFLHFLSSFLQFKSIYLFSSAYIVMLSIFHMALFVQVSMGWLEFADWKGRMVPWVNQAGWYTLLALASLSTGMGLQGIFSRADDSAIVDPEAKNLIRAHNLARIRFLGWGLFYASILLLLVLIATLGNFLAMSRFELFYGNHDGRFLGVFTMIFPAALVALVVSENSRLQRTTGFVLAGLGFLVLLASGYRSIAMFPLLVGAILWVKLGHRIPTILAVGMIAFVLIAIPVIGVLRHQISYEQMDMNEISKSAEGATMADGLATMGGTLIVTSHTMRLVPAKEDFRMGGTYLSYLSKSIPNLGSSADSGDSRRAILSGMRASEDMLAEMVPSDWATYHILRAQFAGGGGVGFSGVAEPYMNFGYAGVVLYFGLLGMLLAKMDSVKLVFRYRWLFFATFLFWNLLVTVRNDFGIFIKPSFFTLIVIGIWLLIEKTGLLKFLK